jgi:alcohol dehydrogenase class IV
VTAATGIDAFVHCFEAFCAPGFHPLADGVALEGMRLIHRYLPRACADGKDIEARAQMLAAASMGATAFQKGLGGVHAIAHPVGSWFNTHHGLTNAIILPYVMATTATRSPTRRRDRARARLAGARLRRPLAWVLRCAANSAYRIRLAAIGVSADKAEIIGREAAIDPSAGGNPIPVDAARSSISSAPRSRALSMRW